MDVDVVYRTFSGAFSSWAAYTSAMRSEEHLQGGQKAHATLQLQSTEVSCLGANKLESLGSLKLLHALSAMPELDCTLLWSPWRDS